MKDAVEIYIHLCAGNIFRHRVNSVPFWFFTFKYPAAGHVVLKGVEIFQGRSGGITLEARNDVSIISHHISYTSRGLEWWEET